MYPDKLTLNTPFARARGVVTLVTKPLPDVAEIVRLLPEPVIVTLLPATSVSIFGASNPFNDAVVT
jgi:hypothetical protein